jgi:hypothetical protein
MRYNKKTDQYDGLNDSDREEFVKNYEPLYREWLRSRVGITTFVRTHRAEIDEPYLAQLNAEPAS